MTDNKKFDKFVEKLAKELSGTHVCEIKKYPCRCKDQNIEDSNFWLVPKKFLNELVEEYKSGKL